MEMVPYLNFNGNAREAMTFYAEVLGAEVEAMMSFGDMPGMECTDAQKEMIAHARINAGGFRLMASDAFGGNYDQPKGTNVCLQVADKVEAERIFAALSEGGTVTMEPSETFWAEFFGMCADRFGTPWMVNCEKPMDQKPGDGKPA